MTGWPGLLSGKIGSHCVTLVVAIPQRPVFRMVDDCLVKRVDLIYFTSRPKSNMGGMTKRRSIGHLDQRPLILHAVHRRPNHSFKQDNLWLPGRVAGFMPARGRGQAPTCC